MNAESACPRCGGAFACGMNAPGPCACTTLVLSAALQARLRAQYEGCLCLACLRELAAGENATMPNLKVVEIKAFVPARDFALSKQFYRDIGFTMASDGDGVAYFHHGEASFLLQDFYAEALAQNLMMHLLVEDVDAWHAAVAGVAQRYGVKIGPIELQPWRMRDFVLFDPSGVLWRIAQNVGE